MRHKRRLKTQPCQSAEKEHIAHGWLLSFRVWNLAIKSAEVTGIGTGLAGFGSPCGEAVYR